MIRMVESANDDIRVMTYNVWNFENGADWVRRVDDTRFFFVRRFHV